MWLLQFSTGDLSTSRAVRIFKCYGHKVIAVMSDDPYRLTRDLRGIDFRSADVIAMRLGLTKEAPQCLAARPLRGQARYRRAAARPGARQSTLAGGGWTEGRTGKMLSASQRVAVVLVLAAKVSVITGGPGVGKTMLLDTVLRVLAAKGVRLLLATPTGRAAKRKASHGRADRAGGEDGAPAAGGRPEERRLQEGQRRTTRLRPAGGARELDARRAVDERAHQGRAAPRRAAARRRRRTNAVRQHRPGARRCYCQQRRGNSAVDGGVPAGSGQPHCHQSALARSVERASRRMGAGDGRVQLSLPAFLMARLKPIRSVPSSASTCASIHAFIAMRSLPARTSLGLSTPTTAARRPLRK